MGKFIGEGKKATFVDGPPESAGIANKAGWVTIDDPPVFINGPSQGSGSGGSTSFTEAATTGKVASSEELGGGVCDSMLIEYEDDGTGVWKDMQGASGYHDGNSEIAAYRMNRLLGGEEVPTTVRSDREVYSPVSPSGKVTFYGTAQEFVPEADMPNWVHLDDLAQVPREQIERVFTLDIIIGNADRHHGNWLLKDGNLIAIDHGHAQWNLWEGGRKTAGWRNKLWHAWDVATRRAAGMSRDSDPPSILSSKGANHGEFSFSPSNLSRWSQITREQFDRVMTGVDQSRNVNLDNAWENLQHIVENGEVTW
jgi:hypothetical protein